MPEFISLAAALLSGWLFVRLILWRSEWLSALARAAVSVVDALLSPLPEAEKLPLVERRNLHLLAALGRFFLLMGVAFAAGWAVVQAGDFFVASVAPWTVWHWGLFSVGATLPFLRRPKHDGPYSPIQQLFHHLVLDHPYVGRMLFKREAKRVLKGQAIPEQPFLIVTGLARAGTTSLLNLLSETGAFASLNYRHMPFLMAPGTWARWHKPTTAQAQERSHGDGIEVSLESNEALEEYFFSAYDGYVKESQLKEYALSEARAADYATYRALVCAEQGGGLYLAKNNNTLLRYASLSKHFPAMRTVVLFRQPIFHASSLMDMHMHFSAEQEKDPFFLTYMNWLGHFEFGQNVKAFTWSDGSGMPVHAPVTLDDWLERWIAYYERALALKNDQMLLLSYDRYCAQPCQAVNALLQAVGVSPRAPEADAHQNERPAPEGASEEVLRRALNLYDRLLIHEMPLEA